MSFALVGELAAAPAITIEIDDLAAGIAIREDDSYVFVASDARFHLLDGSRFRRLQQIETAVRRMVRATHPRRHTAG